MQFPYTPLQDEAYCQLNDGKEYKTKYIGCIGVKTSMRSLCHVKRSEVAKESIIRLCEANKISTTSERKRLDHISRMLHDEPNLDHTGTEVQLSVTSTHLKVVRIDDQRVIVQHEMPNVSFASSGDKDTVDFVAYVAKDSKYERACFVFECGYETAKNVLDTIAQGFELRSQQLTGTLSKNNNTTNQDRCYSLHSTMRLADFHDTTLEPSHRINNENQRSESVITATRNSLEKEPWFHGSYLSREESETRLKHDGDFLVRESMLDPGHFVLSVMNGGTKLHLLFDSMFQVRTKEKIYHNISHLVKFHHGQHSPIVADNRIVYLLNGVRPNPRV